MNPEEIAEVKKHEELMMELRCPSCGGFQMVEGYFDFTQYRCGRCYRVESSKAKSDRAIAKMWAETKIKTIIPSKLIGIEY